MNVEKILITLLLLTGTMQLSSAYASGNPIPCPPVQFIQQHYPHVNAVMIVTNHDYAVYTSIPFYDSASGLKWQVGTEVHTTDFNTAYETGRTNIKSTAVSLSQYAEYLVDFWLCTYSDGVNENRVTAYLTSKIHDDVIM